MITTITDLLKRETTHNDPHEAVELSFLLRDIEFCLQTRTITEQQYVELMVDVERLKKIIALKENLELNQLIHDAILGLIELAKAVKL